MYANKKAGGVKLKAFIQIENKLLILDIKMWTQLSVNEMWKHHIVLTENCESGHKVAIQFKYGVHMPLLWFSHASTCHSQINHIAARPIIPPPPPPTCCVRWGFSIFYLVIHLGIWVKKHSNQNTEIGFWRRGPFQLGGQSNKAGSALQSGCSQIFNSMSTNHWNTRALDCLTSRLAHNIVHCVCF